MKIVLIGFMGSGKSTVAALLSTRLGVPLLEVDAEIVKRAGGMTIPEIFDAWGEKMFRDLESQVVYQYAREHSLIISAGGGTPEREDNMLALKAGECCTVYLEVPFSTVQKRLHHNSERPLLRDRERAQALHERRKEIYRRYADLVISGEDSPEKICEQIEAWPGVKTI